MIELNELRAAFAAHLSADPLRFSMDKALAHVCQLAYQRGLEDGANPNAILSRAAPKFRRADCRILETKNLCGYCGGTTKPGIAIHQTVTGSADFPGGEVVTLT